MYRQLPERFKVAFSFAGAQRDLVRSVAECLEADLGVGNVFFDEWFEYHIAGEDADLRLQEVYLKKSDLVIVCVASAYNDRPWTQLEHRAIRALTMELGRLTNNSSRVLPLRVGPGDVDGINANAIVPDVQARSVADIASLVLARLQLIASPASYGGSSQPHEQNLAPRDIEEALCAKAEVEFRQFLMRRRGSSLDETVSLRLRQNIEREYAPFTVFEEALSIRIETIILPAVEERIRIEAVLRRTHRVSFDSQRIVSIRLQVREFIVAELPRELQAAHSDAISHLLHAVGTVARYKEDELDAHLIKRSKEQPTGLFRIVDDLLTSARAESVLVNLK